MNSTTAYLSFIALFDALFFLNAILINSFRKSVDAAPRHRSSEKALLKGWIENEGTILRFLLGVFIPLYFLMWIVPISIGLFLIDSFGYCLEAIGGEAENDGDDDAQPGCLARHGHKFEAFFLGTLRKETIVERQFPNWKPLPCKFAALSTTTLFIGFAIIFKQSEIGRTAVVTPSKNFCPDKRLNTKVGDIVDEIFAATNVAEALSQAHITITKMEALQNDTGRWSECDNPNALIKNHSQFLNVYGQERGTTFFPGVCLASQRLALEKAINQTCMKSFCAEGTVVDPKTISATPGEITGLEDFQSRLDATREALYDLEPKCDGCNLWGGIKSIFGYRPDVYIDGAPELEASLDYLSYTEFGVTPPIVKYEKETRSFCASHKVPCPDFSKYEEVLKTDYKFLKQEKFLEKDEKKTLEFNHDAYIPDEHIRFVEDLFRQLVFIGHLYAGYTCLAFFFPSPLVLFKPGFWQSFKDFFIGVNKGQFVMASLAVYWGFKYLDSLTFLSELNIFVRAFILEPCLAREEYSNDIGGNYTSVCSSLIAAGSDWANARLTIHSIMPVIEAMNKCCGNCPYVSLNQDLFTNTTHEHMHMMHGYGFNFSDSVTSFGPGISMYVLAEEPVTFIGNVSLCADDDFIAREVLGLREENLDGSSGWIDIWIWSGWLSSILLTSAIANFGVSLARLADPLGAHNGLYEGPPDALNFPQARLAEIKDEKIEDLWWASLRDVLIWVILVHLMLLNIVFTKADYGDGITEEVVYPAFVLGVACFLFFLGLASLLLGNDEKQIIASDDENCAA